MTRNEAENLLDNLLDRGFDSSRISSDDDDDVDETDRRYFVRPWCSQCEALAINGVACHETGCPNIPRHIGAEEDDE